jgi:hypothetical protein
MSNYKDMMAFIESLISRDKPFLIIKYCLSSLDMANNAYEIVTLGGKKLRYFPIERPDAVSAITRFELPLLHEMDNRNMIWGDERFKEKYKRLCLKEI